MVERTCSVDGCGKPLLAKTFCNRHYLRWKKYGDPQITNWGLPAQGLESRACIICGTMFQPYRLRTVTCSEACYKQQPEYKERKNSSRRVGTNPARREVNLRNNLRRYGVTPDVFRAMVERQSNRCAICGDPPDPNGIKSASRLHVDHDHVTGRNRDLLCCRCNQGIGYFKDDPALFHKAAEYIERHRT